MDPLPLLSQIRATELLVIPDIPKQHKAQLASVINKAKEQLKANPCCLKDHNNKYS